MIEILGQLVLFVTSLSVVLGIVVLIHELGHYSAGRFFGAAVESFSMGFGKSIAERTDRRGTRWRLNWIPLGGFVKFVGEAQGPRDVGQNEQGPTGKPYNDLNPWQRIVVSLAGPIANFLLAILLFTAILWANGSARERVVIESVAVDGPAAEAGFETGDIVVAIEGKAIQNSVDFMLPIQLGANDPLAVEVERDGSPVSLVVTPQHQVRDNGLGQQQPLGTIGVAFGRVAAERQTYGPVGALVAGTARTGDTIDMTVDMIVRMVTGKEALSNLSGPVGIADVSRRVVNRTMAIEQVSLSRRVVSLFWTAVQLCALVSVGIGLFNLLPLPILDGGHVVFHLYEAVTGKALPEKIQEGALTVGFFLLIGLFVVVTFGDILETGVIGTTGN
ncbi:MAG: M50 family metallopeptidase [Pseudomonadota bacterium]